MGTYFNSHLVSLLFNELFDSKFLNADIQVVAALGDSLTVRTLGPRPCRVWVTVSAPGPSSSGSKACTPGLCALLPLCPDSIRREQDEGLILQLCSQSGV